MIYYYLITALVTLLCLIFLIFHFELNKVNYLLIVLFLLLTITNSGFLAIALSETLSEAILAKKVCYFGACFLPAVLLFLVCEICNYKVSMWVRRVIYSICFFVYAMVLSIGFTDWYYKDISLRKIDGVSVLAYDYGSFHVLFYVILYGSLALEGMILLYSLWKKHAVSRKNLYALLLLSLTNVVLFVVVRYIRSDFEIMALVYALDSVILLYLFRRGMMYSIDDNIAGSLAKHENSGYIMFDNQWNYLGCNDFVTKVFPDIKECVVDRPLKEFQGLHVIFENMNHYMNTKKDTFNVQIGEEHYEGKIERIRYRKKPSGYIIELKEDTDNWKYLNLLTEHNNELQHFQAELEEKVKEQTREIREQQEKMRELYLQTIIAISDSVDAKDRYTSGHSKRVAKYAGMIAARMGKSKEEQDAIYHAGLMHDVGKIRIPDDIINKPGKLTDEEFEMIKVHPIAGFHILNSISNENAVAAKYHHERYDGKGYPNGIAGEMIPEVARILGVADSYDAMASNRSYRNALPQEKVRSEIEKGKGTQFDPEIADIMLQMIDEDKEYKLRELSESSKRILIVDDDEENHEIFKEIMADEPIYEVISASGGREALEILKKESVDLIVLDIKMPDMNGIETLEYIREKYKTPVVFMTSDRSLTLLADFASYGCNDYITKPFLALVVKEVVHNMTEITLIEG